MNKGQKKYIKRNIHELFSRSLEGRRFMRVLEKIMKFSKYADWYISNAKKIKNWRQVLMHLHVEYVKCLGKPDKCILIRQFICKWFKYNLAIILPWNYHLLALNMDNFGLYQQLISY